MATPQATYFIADKLRGIPLVTAPGRHRQQQQNDNQNVERLVPVAKRDAADLGSSSLNNQQGDSDKFYNRQVTQPSDSGLLFKPSAMTASTANIVRAKVSTRATATTTRKPPTTTTYKPRTTTRKWKTITTTTTTQRPTTTKYKHQPVSGRLNNGKLAQLIDGRQVADKESRQQTGPPSPTPISTLSMSRAQKPMGITEPSPRTNRIISSFSQVDYEPTTLPPASMTSSKSTTETSDLSTESQPNSISQTSLTRSTQQTLTTLPLNQRRTPGQTVPTFPRFTNRPSDSGRSAGENWVLFNRQDGSFSLFEILVLLSNVMIVSTIILVIILGWVKAFKKRKATQSSKRKSLIGERQQPVPGASNTGNNGGASGGNNNVDMLSNLSRSPTMVNQDVTSDRGSKISMISSGISGLTSATASESYQTQNQQQSMATTSSATTNLQPGNQTLNEMVGATNEAIVSKLDEKAKGLIDSVQRNQVVGSVKNIQSEFKTSGMNVANKAMAIVQPTENSNLQSHESNADRKANAIRDELKGSQKPAQVSRSVSDLSGSNAKLANKLPKDQESDHNLDGVKKEGVALLTDFFNGSVPNLPAATSSGNSDKPELETTEGEKNSPIKPSNALKTSSNSLDSIELPGELVETIKKSGLRNPDHIAAPSPNLLLGQEQKPPVAIATTTTNGNIAATSTTTTSNTTAITTTSTGGTSTPAKVPEKPTAQTNVASSANKETEKSNIKSNVAKSKKQNTNPQSDRPPNPMGKQIEDKKPAAATSATSIPADGGQLKNHQVVVNRLDKRKTNLEIVDLRDESVTGKIKIDSAGNKTPTGEASQWISMDGLAVVQPVNQSQQQQQVAAQQQQQSAQNTVTGANPQPAAMSPSEIIESRFNVDYSGKRKLASNSGNASAGTKQDSMDSRAEEYMLNNIENELELDNKMKNRKYFVYVVHDGHFTAKKECIARIELPPKRRITLAELRGLIANSQDISLSSLRKNRFKFVTETYRLLNENEDAAVLHQVYPTQGVFLKLNIPEQEGQVYAFKGGARSRLSSGGRGSATGEGSSLSQTTIASRRRANFNRTGQPRGQQPMGDGSLPAIEVESSGYGRVSVGRASSVGRSRVGAGGSGSHRVQPASSYGRSKSSVQAGRRSKQQELNDMLGAADKLPTLGRSQQVSSTKRVAGPIAGKRKVASGGSTLGNAASDLGANVLSGAKKLLNNFL